MLPACERFHPLLPVCLFSVCTRFFTTVGVHLKHQIAFTYSQLGNVVQRSYKALDVLMTQLIMAMNVRDLLTPCMFAIPHVTKPQAFHVVKDPPTVRSRCRCSAGATNIHRRQSPGNGGFVYLQFAVAICQCMYRRSTSMERDKCAQLPWSVGNAD